MQEQVEQFGQRLAEFGVTVKELSGDQNLTKAQVRLNSISPSVSQCLPLSPIVSQCLPVSPSVSRLCSSLVVILAQAES